MSLRTRFHSENAPKAIGPYSQAVRIGQGPIFLSGQVPLDPATGQLVEGDIEAQTIRVMQNLRQVLAAAGCTFEHVVRCGIFLVDLNDFAKVNEVYARHFPENPPARSTVQVSALPKGARVEIDAVAVLL
jgi:2-iminobutanoate/2-iminopropanoate deaminase